MMERRRLLRIGGACLAGLTVAKATAQNDKATAQDESGGAHTGVLREAPPQHLMREHAVLERILIIYENGAQRLSNQTFSMQVLSSAADLVREVIEDHHMRLE